MYINYIYNCFFQKDDTCVKTKKTYQTTQLIYHITTSNSFSNDEGSKHNVDDGMEPSRYHTYKRITILSSQKQFYITLFVTSLLSKHLLFYLFILLFFLQPKHTYNTSNNSSNDCVGLPCVCILLQAS